MTWRVGRQVPHNLYENDQPRGMLLDTEVAQRVVATLNAAEKLEPHWLVKDFEILYLAALDVSESIVEPDQETPPQRFLRAQLERLRPAFEEIQQLKAFLRDRERGK